MTTITRPGRDNRAVLRLLASPLHPLLSSRVCALSYVGARTGSRHLLPVEYTRDDDRIVVLAANAAAKRWWRNFTGAGRTVTVTIRRHPHVGHAVALAPGDPGYPDALSRYARRRHAPRDADHRLVVIRLLSD